ncbi:hexose-6-phosphate:phosphate antiporter [Listeria ivanovii]|uniref:hexose phosphate transporter Hpt n=1 Tax=Listeria ivanovii TaxID=1638 RepID=UPI000DA720DB|nr:hexose phosphate transporter Hpt [Listeria ivanovii]PZG35671.1 hexose-6-phosphate:phosphate antiporter [Listeria ivanovii]PZG49438.1 hexose-6-phosphate:phosphate antiporter [Listeria ivanovii]PZH13628.1 hexose-6-phosphate:phosphate antiporter [Listeria ivanovii]
MSLFSLKRKNYHIPLEIQRQQWFRNFIVAFMAVFVCYLTVYLLRNNFKAAQTLLIEQNNFSTTELGMIGLAFSVAYGIGKTILGYGIDGRNAKKIMSFLLGVSAIISIIIGILLITKQATTGILFILWGANGFVQSPGGPASYSTITRWTPKLKRGKWLGFWNASHNIGGALAGIIAFWGATTFFNGGVGGMFIVPAIIALIIAIICFYIGYDEPEELGWNSAPEIFEEPEEHEESTTKDLTKFQIFRQFVINNPWVWTLCIINIFIYIVRIGIDNWAPVYCIQALGWDTKDAILTISFFEIGALLGSLSWGWLSDIMKGRRMLCSIIAVAIEFFMLIAYSQVTSVYGMFTVLFILGFLVFGPQLLIGVSVIEFVPKSALAVTNGLTGTFAYLFGDSFAKVFLGYIADPTKSGMNIFGYTLHGWGATFTIMFTALIIAGLMMIPVALKQERTIRKLS